MKLREWQAACLEEFFKRRREMGSDIFVFEACPGAGKSHMAAEMSWQMLNDESGLFDGIHFVVALVPWKSIQGDEYSGMTKDFTNRGLDVRQRFFIRSNRLVEQPFPSGVDGVVTTYHEVCNQETLDVLNKWMAKGLRFALICDEIHHANETSGSWGGYLDQMQKLASFTIVMSGTYFRTDQQPITFVDYDDSDPPRPDTHYSYPYARGVADQVVRSVGCRYLDCEVKLWNSRDKSKSTEMLSSIMPNNAKAIRAACKEVFHPEGETVRLLIHEVHEHMLRTRKRFYDAAALFTCRPGKDTDEDRHVHQIASKIRQYTGVNPVVVTHRDKNAIGKIEAFRNGQEPYLVAVNMITEGVDIKRIRSVCMMRYIASEMMFRQIIGRAIRTIDGQEDGTAAKVFMPKFNLMHQFGMNLEGEALEGLKDLTCKKCGFYPCECPCARCRKPKQECICEGEPKPASFIEALSADPVSGGGTMTGREVEEIFIQTALHLMRQSSDMQHANSVQLGNFLQRFSEQGGAAPVGDGAPNPAEERKALRSKVNRLMNKLAGKKYGGDFAQCWYENLLEPHGVDWKTAQNSWSIVQLEQLRNELEDKLVEAYRNGS